MKKSNPSERMIEITLGLVTIVIGVGALLYTYHDGADWSEKVMSTMSGLIITILGIKLLWPWN